MQCPVPYFSPNKDLKGPALKAFKQHFDELVLFKGLQKATYTELVNKNFPLFLIPKPFLVGEFWTIADGKPGG